MQKFGLRRTLGFTLCFVMISAVLISVSAVSAKFLLAENASVLSQDCPVVIIDAGHGGRDGGASASDGTQEKTLNLQVAKKLQALFESVDITVVMTRDDDVALGGEDSKHKKLEDLQARVRTAAQYDNAVFVSIHMNKFPVEKYSGLQVYYSRAAQGSQPFAEAVQHTVKTHLQEANSRECKGAGSEIYVLGNAPCPAILIECGFLSNERDLRNLRNDAYQSKLALCIFAAVINSIYENQVM